MHRIAVSPDPNDGSAVEVVLALLSLLSGTEYIYTPSGSQDVWEKPPSVEKDVQPKTLV